MEHNQPKVLAQQDRLWPTWHHLLFWSTNLILSSVRPAKCTALHRGEKKWPADLIDSPLTSWHLGCDYISSKQGLKVEMGRSGTCMVLSKWFYIWGTALALFAHLVKSSDISVEDGSTHAKCCFFFATDIIDHKIIQCFSKRSHDMIAGFQE